MVSKGRKNGSGKPAAPKAAAHPAKPIAPKAKLAGAKTEKPAPVASKALVAPSAAIEPVPAVVVPQEVEAVAKPVADVARAVVEQVEAAAEAIVPESEAPVLETAKETLAAAKAAIPSAIKETKIMETIENNVAKTQAFFADFQDRAKGAVEKSTQLVAEANDFAKGNLEAMVESSKIAANGLQSFSQEAAEYSRKSFESATAAMKTLATVKSPTDFFKLQSDYFRTSFDSYVAEASKTTEAMMKLAGEAAQPLSNRVAIAAEKAKIAA